MWHTNFQKQKKPKWMEIWLFLHTFSYILRFGLTPRITITCASWHTGWETLFFIVGLIMNILDFLQIYCKAVPNDRNRKKYWHEKNRTSLFTCSRSSTYLHSVMMSSDRIFSRRIFNASLFGSASFDPLLIDTENFLSALETKTIKIQIKMLLGNFNIGHEFLNNINPNRRLKILDLQ